LQTKQLIAEGKLGKFGKPLPGQESSEGKEENKYVVVCGAKFFKYCRVPLLSTK